MAQQRNFILTDDEIRQAMDEHSDGDDNGDDTEIEDDGDFSETEANVENNSDVEDEISMSSSDEYDEEDDSTATYIGKDGTEWKNIPYPEQPPQHVRGGIHKVKLPPGKHIDSTMDAFSLFFDDEIIKLIVKYTNMEAQNSSAERWKKTDCIEIRAFIGLLINAGLKKEGISDFGEFWDPLQGCPLFRACMSRNRFSNIRRHLRFDDKNTRSARRDRDKFAPFRDVWETINKNLLKHYIPGKTLTIDEQLVPFRGRVSFLQYIPSKPDKYGMKIFWICDSSNSYPLKGIPYLGQEGANRGKNLGQRIVEELCIPFERSNRIITFDNFFTSFELAQNLLKSGLMSVGTLRKNKTYIPPAFLPHRHREVESNIFGFRKHITLVSYVPKRNRAVLLLSTLHHTGEIDVNNKNKSEINLFYNSTKGGVDVLDQMAHAFSAKRKSNRWPVVQFYNLIDVCGIAAKVIWLNLYPNWNIKKTNIRRKLFLKDLVQEMVVPNIQRRSAKYLNRAAVSGISEVLDHASTSMEIERLPETPKSDIRRRCHMCPSKKCRVSKQCCSLCEKNICTEHSTKMIICKNCINK